MITTHTSITLIQTLFYCGVWKYNSGRSDEPIISSAGLVTYVVGNRLRDKAAGHSVSLLIRWAARSPRDAIGHSPNPGTKRPRRQPISAPQPPVFRQAPPYQQVIYHDYRYRHPANRLAPPGLITHHIHILLPYTPRPGPSVRYFNISVRMLHSARPQDSLTHACAAVGNQLVISRRFRKSTANTR